MTRPILLPLPFDEKVSRWKFCAVTAIVSRTP